LIKFLSSIRLTIVLLILIIILSVTGTLIPQGETPGFYQHYSPRWSGIILGLQFDHLYRSPLFLSLAFLFLLNILFCSSQKLPAKFRQIRGQIEFAPAEGQSGSEKKLTAGFADWLWFRPDSLAAELRKRHYRVKIEETSTQKTLLAQKGQLGLFGPEIVHLGIVIVIIGGLISALFSQRMTLALSEGQTVDLPGKTFSLRLDRFMTDYYPDGSVKSWQSLVSIIEQGQVKKQKRVEVNHPLKYDGLNFFQMSYGFDWDRTQVELEIKGNHPAVSNLTLKVGEKVEIGPGLALSLLTFIPDFELDQEGQPASRSAEANQPAALVQVTRDGQPVYRAWLFYYQPDLNRVQSQPDFKLEIRLKKFKAPVFSGLEAASDPGMNPVWLGSALLFLGLLACFYTGYRQLAVRVQPPAKPALTARSRRNQAAFYRELEELLSQRPDKLR
jgi:cytochrome c biogenesis protein